MNRIALFSEKKLKAQSNNFKTLVRNATSTMFQAKKLKRNATSTIAEVALRSPLAASDLHVFHFQACCSLHSKPQQLFCTGNQ